MTVYDVSWKVFDFTISRIWLVIKSASGINSAPHMYEGDRNADLAFDTTHLNIHFTNALEHVVHLKQMIFATNLAEAWFKEQMLKKGNLILLPPSYFT